MDELDKKINGSLAGIKKQGPGTKKSRCPDDNLLASYADGVLRDNVKEGVERHLTECNNCLDLVISYNKVKVSEAHEAVPDVPTALINKAMDLVKDKGEGIFDIVLKFARETIDIITNPGNLGISYSAVPVPVRSGESPTEANLITLNRTFSEVESAVDVERVGEGRVNISTRIKDISSGKPAEGLRVSLLDPDREIASYIAKNGEACFEGLGFGKYVLRYQKHGEETGRISLNIKR
jgi:hypothetical protein